MQKIKITKHLTYKKVFANCSKIVVKNFVLLYKELKVKDSEDGSFMFGITASKKIGNAVKRNRCKRIIRTLIKQLDLPLLKKDLYINVVARKNMTQSTFSGIQDHFNRYINKLVYHEKKNQ